MDFNINFALRTLARGEELFRDLKEAFMMDDTIRDILFTKEVDMQNLLPQLCVVTATISQISRTSRVKRSAMIREWVAGVRAALQDCSGKDNC